MGIWRWQCEKCTQTDRTRKRERERAKRINIENAKEHLGIWNCEHMPSQNISEYYASSNS